MLCMISAYVLSNICLIITYIATPRGARKKRNIEKESEIPLTSNGSSGTDSNKSKDLHKYDNIILRE